MIDPDGLNVWKDDRLVGYLWRSDAGIGFRYDTDWLADGFAISLTLPLSEDAYSPEKGVARRFFANLLPEGRVRERIVRALRLPDTDFDLVRAIGGECAGALSVLPVGMDPARDRRYSPLSDQELSELVARRGQPRAYRPGPEDAPRFSLAGAQEKCPVLIKEGRFFLPLGDSPSTHIMKFQLADYRHVPAYEAFLTMLATRIGLPVVDAELRALDGRPGDAPDDSFLVIRRYDRALDDHGDVQRIHQEDFCQALGHGYHQKYEEDAGPSFADCFRLLQEHASDPTDDTRNLLRWQIFNVLAGNSDGHAKNLALLYPVPGVIRLAPFYDLVCTRAIQGVNARLAFSVGGEFEPGNVRQVHWERLAAQCDVARRYLIGLVSETAELLRQAFPHVREIFEQRYGAYPALQRVEQALR